MSRRRAVVSRSHLRLSGTPIGLIVLIGVLVAFFGGLKPEFFNGQFVIAPLLTQISIFTIVGLAQMAALSIGHMNLAIGQMAAFGAMFAGMSFELWGAPLIVGVLIGLLAGAVVGAVTGWLIARTGVNSFIVTLAMSFALIGLVPTVYKALSTGSAFTVKPAGFDALGRGALDDVCVGQTCGSAAIPLMLGVAIAVMALVGYLYGGTRLGRELLMTGSNYEAATLSGIPTGRRVIFVHALSGTLSALAGILLAASTGSFTPGIGQEFLLQSFLGPILGGTVMAGGFVSITGTFLGIVVILIIRKGLELFGVGVDGLNILLGLILLFALSTGRIRGFVTRRRARPAAPESATPDSTTARTDAEEVNA